MPKYKIDKRLNVHVEVNSPPSSIYIGLGHDPEQDSKQKHYRRYYNDELEETKAVMEKQTPFEQYDIMKGQSRGNSKGLMSLFSKDKTDDSGAITTEQSVGKFKGVITVNSQEEKEEFK